MKLYYKESKINILKMHILKLTNKINVVANNSNDNNKLCIQ